MGINRIILLMLCSLMILPNAVFCEEETRNPPMVKVPNGTYGVTDMNDNPLGSMTFTSNGESMSFAGSGLTGEFEWRETGGPPIAVPGPPGYGSSVIRELIPYELGGSVQYVFAAEGVRCRLEIPGKWLSNPVRQRPKHAAAVAARVFS